MVIRMPRYAVILNNLFSKGVLEKSRTPNFYLVKGEKEMEYMSIDHFLAASTSKLLNKGLEGKFGFNPKLNLQYLHVQTCTDDNDADYVEVALNIQMDVNDFNRLIEEVTK